MAPHRWHWRISQCSALSQHAQCFTLVMECLLREPWSLQPIQRCVIVSTCWSSVDTFIIILAREVNLLFFDSSVNTISCFQGICFIRTSRPDTAVIYDAGEKFELGKAKVRKIKKRRPEHTFKLFIVSIFSYKLQQVRLNLASMLNFVILV